MIECCACHTYRGAFRLIRIPADRDSCNEVDASPFGGELALLPAITSHSNKEAIYFEGGI